VLTIIVYNFILDEVYAKLETKTNCLVNTKL